ncbi:MAG TPA: P1 family peptidase [Acidisarcina sp.]|nr:P1 family peptidase [Acidisarcina sp.]
MSKHTRSLEFDFPGLRIGVAEYASGPTGVTIFDFPSRAFGVFDSRGGAPGSSLTETLRMGFGRYIDAVAFCGGSAYGLEAASGVAAGLLRSGRRSTRWGEVAIVPAAVVFDFKGRHTQVYPDRELGIDALNSVVEGHFPLGARGAGAFVHCGSYFGENFMERSGQGAAFRQFGATRLAVFTVVNARGAIVNRAGQVVVGNRDPQNGTRTAVPTMLESGNRPEDTPPQGRSISDNTTLTLVVTNRVLDQGQLQRLAIEVHSSMARAIQPFHTSRDGDTLFAVSTAECYADTPDVADLSVYASELAWDAVLNSVPEL